jgi:hypothetical protein
MKIVLDKIYKLCYNLAILASVIKASRLSGPTIFKFHNIITTVIRDLINARVLFSTLIIASSRKHLFSYSRIQ